MDKPEPLNENTTKSMKSNKRKDTSPELIVRKALREAGYPGYRLQWDVSGRPDIAYPGKKVAIFVNGCFWHRCPRCDYGLPKHNSEYWMEKFNRNMERDERNHADLETMGWICIVVWECEIKKDLEGVIDMVVDALNKEIRL
jgi:DNA mismatch endonuclease, patch repair protein